MSVSSAHADNQADVLTLDQRDRTARRRPVAAYLPRLRSFQDPLEPFVPDVQVWVGASPGHGARACRKWRQTGSTTHVARNEPCERSPNEWSIDEPRRELSIRTTRKDPPPATLHPWVRHSGGGVNQGSCFYRAPPKLKRRGRAPASGGSSGRRSDALRRPEGATGPNRLRRRVRTVSVVGTIGLSWTTKTRDMRVRGPW